MKAKINRELAEWGGLTISDIDSFDIGNDCIYLMTDSDFYTLDNYSLEDRGISVEDFINCLIEDGVIQEEASLVPFRR